MPKLRLAIGAELCNVHGALFGIGAIDTSQGIQEAVIGNK
jgi:hypothetical protein